MGKQQHTKTVYFNEGAYNSAFAELAQAKEAFANLLNEYNRLGLPSIKSMVDLLSLSREGREFIYQVLEKAVPDQKVAGMNIDKRKTVELLELPDLTHLDDLRAEAGQYEGYTNFLEIHGATVRLSASATEDLKARYSIRATTPEQVALYESHEKLVQAMEEFTRCHEEVYGHIIQLGTTIDKLVRVTQDNNLVSSEVIPAVTRGDETIEPAYTKQQYTKQPAVVVINQDYYRTNPFPVQ